MTIRPTTPLMLDSNEYIFGLSGTKASCVQLIDHLDTLRVFVPLMVVREVERNLELMYSLSSLLPGSGSVAVGLLVVAVGAVINAVILYFISRWLAGLFAQ